MCGAAVRKLQPQLEAYKLCGVRRYLGVNQLSGPLPTWLTIMKQLNQL